MKKVLCFVLVLVSLFGLTAVHADEKVTIELMLHKDEAVELMQTMVAEFSKVHPEIEIIVNQPSDYDAATQSRFLANDMPDMWTWANDSKWYAYFEEDYFLDLSDQEWMKSAFSDSALSMVTFNGKVIGFPCFVNAWGVYYNVDLFKQVGVEVPTTLDELWAVCEAFKAAGITPIELSDAEAWTCFNNFERLAGLDYNDQGELFEKIAAGEESATTNAGIRLVAETIAKLHEYAQEDPMSTSCTDAYTALANGEAAMLLNGTWSLPLIQTAGDANISTFAFPAVNAEDTKVAANLDMTINVCSSTKNAEACMTFLQWLAQPENATTLTNGCGGLPIINGATSNLTVFQALTDKIAEGKTYGIARNYWRSGTKAVIQPLVQTLCGDCDVEAFLTSVDDEIKLKYAE